MRQSLILFSGTTAIFLHADEHADEDSNIFLMRVEFDPTDFDIDLADFAQHFAPIATKFEMQWRLAQSRYHMKMVILVSKYDHCLVDLLYRHRSGELDVEIPLMNHPDNQTIADFYRIPYATIPVTSENRRDAEDKTLTLVQQCKADFLVLARYMQILSHEFVRKYPNRIINIHHSFLPAFAGSKPYHQAYLRGVKLIGATSHYVTDVLDDGPIIEPQGVVRVSHRDSLADLLEKGREWCCRGPCDGTSRAASSCTVTRQ